MGCAIFAAVRTVQLDTAVSEARIQEAIEEQVSACELMNRVFGQAYAVAIADVEEDRRIWQSIDEILDGGIPEPTRSVIFRGLETRQVRAAETYTQSNCITAPLEDK